MRDEHTLHVGVLFERGGEVGGLRRLTPRVFEQPDVEAVGRGELLPALPEVADGDDERRVAGREAVHDGALEPARSRGRQQQHFVLGAEDVLQTLDDLAVHRRGAWPAVVHDRRCLRRVDLRRQRHRPRQQQDLRPTHARKGT
jgi:hypothetical protein